MHGIKRDMDTIRVLCFHPIRGSLCERVAGSIKLTHFNQIVLRVNPVKFLCHPITDRPVRVEDAGGDDVRGSEGGGVETSTLEVLLAHIRPVDHLILVENVDSDSVLENGVDQR